MTIPTLAAWMTAVSPKLSQKVLRMKTGGHMGRPTAIFAGGVNPTTAGGSHGVVGGNDLEVTIQSGLTLAVAPGGFFICGTSSIDEGVYYDYNNATVTTTLAAHDSQPRIDLVWVRARNNAEDGGGATECIVGNTEGTPSGSPVAPAAPSGALVLNTVNVPATSGAVTINEARTFAAALGGLIRCRSTTRPTGAALWEGQQIWETDTNRFFVYDGTAWRGVKSVQINGIGNAVGGITTGEADVLVLAVPDQRCAGVWMVFGHLRYDCTVPGDIFKVRLKFGGVTIAESEPAVTAITVVNPISTTAVAGGAASEIRVSIQRTAGTGTATTTGTATLNRCQAIFIPT